jgi:hypothetical protein
MENYFFRFFWNNNQVGLRGIDGGRIWVAEGNKGSFQEARVGRFAGGLPEGWLFRAPPTGKMRPEEHELTKNKLLS